MPAHRSGSNPGIRVLAARLHLVRPGADRLAENFPALVEHLLVPAEFRKRVLLDLLRPVHGISNG
jgi:hypothetical protein